MPLPRSGYRWRWARTDAPGWSEDGAPPAKGSWVAVPDKLSADDSDALIVDANAVRAKTAQELTAEAQAKSRAAAFEKAVAAELELIGAEALKARLSAAGKGTVRIQQRIDALTAKLVAAVGDLP